MSKLAGLLKRSVVLRDIGDRPDFAHFLPLAHQIGKGNDTVLAKRGDEAHQEHARGVWPCPGCFERYQEIPLANATTSRLECEMVQWTGTARVVGPGDGALISESTLGPLFDCTAILVSDWTLEPCEPDNTSQILTLAALCFSLFGIDPSPNKTVDRPCLGLTRLGR
jgi:hypothetical protein